MLGGPRESPFDPSALSLGADLRLRGIEPSPRRHHRVRRGVWMDCALWQRPTPGQQHAALVHATALCSSTTTEPVFARAAAAAVHGLPRVSPWPQFVTVIRSDRKVSGSGYLHRILGEHRDLVRVQGQMVTSVARTVMDIACTDPLADAVAAADHALRFELTTRVQLREQAGLLPAGRRGRRAAELVAVLADPLAMSAGESLSRVQMFLMNIPRPRLQQEFTDEHGRIGYTDFDWEAQRVVGEFDGRLKYGLTGGHDDPSDVLWREKKRENRLRRQGRDVCRWVWSEALDQAVLGQILASHGIRPQQRNGWLPARSIA